MTEDEIAAVHEAAHAVFAVFGEWTKLAGPVVLKGPGSGDVVMSTDSEAIGRAIEADHGFDRDLPRIHLVRSLLAGPIAERILADTGRAVLGEDELREASEGDYSVIAEQLGQLDPPRPGLLDILERDVRKRLDQPATWSAVERFAAILIERRRLEPEEAMAILHGIRVESAVDVSLAKEEGEGRRRPVLRALILLVRRAVRRDPAGGDPSRARRPGAGCRRGR
jgi:hypothetical protein